MKLLKIAIALFSFLAINTYAQPSATQNPPSAEAKFSSLDKNGDGTISLTEAKSGGISEADFKKIDADGNGTVSKQEFIKAHTIQGGGRM